MIQIQKIYKPDMVGAAASGLCLVHCMATPLLFIASACSATCCIEAPPWWKAIDYLFLGISLVAITTAVKTSTKKWVGKSLYICWAFLLMTILNESFVWIHLPKTIVYIPALCMIGLHLYNQKYCKCNGNNCCVK